MEFDIKILIPVLITAIAPFLGSIIFEFVKKATSWLDMAPTWVKSTLYVIISGGLAALAQFTNVPLPGDLGTVDANTWAAVIIAILNTKIFKMGEKHEATKLTTGG